MKTNLLQFFLVAFISVSLCWVIFYYTSQSRPQEQRREDLITLSCATFGVILYGIACLNQWYWRNFQFCQDTFPRWATDSFEALIFELMDLPINLTLFLLASFLLITLVILEIGIWVSTVCYDLIQLGIGFYVGEVSTTEIVAYFHNPRTIERTAAILDVVLPYSTIFSMFCWYMYLHEKEKLAVYLVTLEHVSTLTPSERRSVSGPFYYNVKKVYRM